MIQPNEHDTFLMSQRFTMVINRYEFTLPNGRPVCFAEQARFKFKEDIRFYLDESKRDEVLRLQARQRFDPAARYDVTDPDGVVVGQIQKVFGASLLRSTYRLYDASGGETATVTEKSLPVALFRRLIGFVGFVPFIGIIAQFSDWLPIPYHFIFSRGDDVLVTHTRRAFKLRDHYTIDCTADPHKTLDRRLVLATAVGLDALQAR